MARYVTSRTIDASAEHVFETVAHIENFSKAVRRIVDVEFLTDTRSGVGTRFKETRLMRGREASTELEVIEYEPNERIRLVSDAGGTVWDSVFSVQPRDDGTELSLVMDARPYKLSAKITGPLISRMVTKGIEADMDAVKAYCEGRAG